MKFNKIITVVILIISLCIPNYVYASSDINGGDTQYFNDISRYSWAKDSINYFGRAGILTGDGKGNYKPSKNVSREEFATMLSNSFNTDIVDNSQTFSDVPSTRWSFKYVESAKEYLTGYYPSTGTPFFAPSTDATREDVAVALAKMLGLSEDDLKNPYILTDSFVDAEDVSTDLRDLMSVVVENNIMVGSDGKLRPKAPITKAEVAVLLYKVMKSTVSEESKSLKLDVDIPEVSKSPDICISGTTVKGAKVKVNGYDAEVDSSGYFKINFTLKKVGQYNVEIIALKNGIKAIENGIIKYGEDSEDEASTKISLTKCPTTSSTSEVTIEGTVTTMNEPAILTINDEDIEFIDNNADILKFSYTTTLKEGANEFTFIVADSASKETKVTRTITYGTGAPELIITQCPELTNQNLITISGTVKDMSDPSPVIYINDYNVYADLNGKWSKNIPIEEGKNTLTIKAVNSNGKSTVITKNVTFTVNALVLTITKCPESSSTETITISGTVTDASDSSPDVYINNSSIDVNSYGSWTKDFTLKDGKNTFTIKATNSNGKSTVITKNVTFTANAPVLTITKCPEASSTETITISGTVTDASDSSPDVYINNSSIDVDSYGSWTKDFTLKDGKNTFTIKATNSNGKSTVITKNITFTANAPVLTITKCPEASSTETITISGTVTDASDSSPDVYINNSSIDVDSYGSWTKDFTLKDGMNTFTIKATNSNGKSTVNTKNVTFTAEAIPAPELTIIQCPETYEPSVRADIPVDTVRSISIFGTVKDANDSSPNVYVNGEKAYVNPRGFWDIPVNLNEGKNTITIKATNSAGKSTETTKIITCTIKIIPVNSALYGFTITECPESSTTNTVILKGTIKRHENGYYPTIAVNKKGAFIDGNEWMSIIKLEPGKNTLVIEVFDPNTEALLDTFTREVIYTADTSTSPTTPTTTDPTTTQNP